MMAPLFFDFLDQFERLMVPRILA